MIGMIANKHVLGYMSMPGFKPRLENLFMTGFQFVSYFMALVYSSVNLLPTNHPYTQIENKGKFGIRHVIAEAANNLELKKENIDQIILFVALLVGIVLMIMQLLMLGMGLFMQPVFAMPTNFAGFFLTPVANEATDIAGIMMDLVFGVAGVGGNPPLFNSCIAQQINCTETLPLPAGGTRDVMVASPGGPSIFQPLGFPFPIHTAMHQMFLIYNTGLLVVAAFIALYFLATVVAETAQTGTAFGRRFNKVWAPIRIFFAFGLLVPVGLNFNTSQWIVLHAAKFGSGFATNGWNLFNVTLTNSYFADMRNMVSIPNIPEVNALLQFMYVANTCKYLEDGLAPVNPQRDIRMYLVKGAAAAGGNEFLQVTPGTTYQALITFAAGSNVIKIRFGEQDADFNDHLGSVFPYCGEITFRLTDHRDPNAGAVLDRPEPGLAGIQQMYWTWLLDLWFNGFRNIAGSTTMGFCGLPPDNFVRNTAYRFTSLRGVLPPGTPLPMPDPNYRSQIRTCFQTFLENNMMIFINLLQNSQRYQVNNLIREKGWAGAAIWYNRIAEMNGAMTSAVLNIPFPSLYPSVQEHIYREKKARNARVSFDKRYHPQIRDGDPVQFREDQHAEMARALWQAFNYWQDGGGATSHAAPTGNAMIDSINALFGTEGLYNIRRNPNTHPLAQIVGVGRGLVESAIRNLTISVVGGVGGSLLKFLDEASANFIKISSTFLITVTMVGLTAGFVLFYVVPFLPFIYFFFAVGGWIKGIFEAMVGAPLWALAHIRIDQNGLPGQAGVAGYFLIFEIFLRPILIIFGMLASISIFSALVSVLNQVFDLVTSNLGGFDYRAEQVGTAQQAGAGAVAVQSTINSARSAVDEFFFTVIYTIIIYLMAMSSFKLIDLIPNNILRWMGQSTATFNDSREDAAQSLVGKATVGSQQTSSALSGGLKSLAG